MKKLNFFARTSILLFFAIIPLACGSDDNDGGETTVDKEAIYSVNAPKTVGDYIAGESLATVTDADGAITQASLDSGSLPGGIALNGSSGALTVSDVAALVPGTYSLAITTEDATGGSTQHTVSITLNEDIDAAASYTVSEAKAVQDYTVGESIATVSDADGDIASAELVGGSQLPAGTALNATTGEITVEDVSLLTSGTYEINILTLDIAGGSTEHTITVVFNQNPDVAAVYTVTQAKPVEEYAQDEAVATVSDDNGDITSADLGEASVLPAGIALNETNGAITVADPNLLVPGSYELEITTEDENGGTTVHTITLVFEENPVIVNINSGGDELIFSDISYMEDQFFVGTSVAFTPAITPTIANTEKDELYLTERNGTDFGYAVELENGTYKVILHFVEIFWGAPGNGAAGGIGDRVFDVSLEGVVVKNDYDIFEDVGALFATQEEFEVNLVDGMLNIGFSASVDNAKISAIEIEKIN